MAKRYYNNQSSHWLIYVVLAVAATAGTWQFWPEGQSGDNQIADNSNTGDTNSDDNRNNSNDESNNSKVKVVKHTIPPNKGATTRPVTKSKPEALAKFKAGNVAFETQKLIEARTLLSDALFQGGLAEDLAEEARSKLTYLAEATIFARTINPDDPYTMRYRFKEGDLASTVERKQLLHIPSQLIVQINGLSDASRFQAGVDYKLIKGPFHAVVYKSTFKMDLFLHRQEDKLPPVFIKRYTVGLGKNNSTPLGNWRLGCGALTTPSGKRERGKLLRAAWNPPPNSIQRRRLEYGMTGYPFGKKGMWISLVGTDENTKNLIDYGIHSTNEQDSIGSQSSMGCVRMRDADIQEVYDRLYEKWSKVQIVP
jgi:hypothetical protein